MMIVNSYKKTMCIKKGEAFGFSLEKVSEGIKNPFSRK